MNIFEELEKDLEESKAEIEGAVAAGVTVDIGVRLGMVAAACTLSKDQLNRYLDTFKNQLLDQWEGEDSRKIAEETFEKIREGVLLLSHHKL